MLTRLACAGLLLASVGAFAQSGAGDEQAIRDLDKQWTAVERGEGPRYHRQLLRG